MALDEITITIPVEQYQRHVPDDYDGDSIDVGVRSFPDKLYLKFPRFDRSGTNDFCMGASSIFEAFVDIRTNWKGEDLYIGPQKRKMGVLHQRGSDVATTDATDVLVETIGDDAPNEIRRLVTEVEQQAGGVMDDQYWQGYRSGANDAGDDYLDWDEIAWRKFDDEWDGNPRLLRDIGCWMVGEGVAVCNRTKALFPIPEWTTPTGSYVASISDVYQGTCPFCGADKDENWECIRSPSSVRKPNVYKCNACGETKRGITTG